MAARGRNHRCACGSGRKVKFCCGSTPGPSEPDLAKAYLVAQRRTAALVLAKVTRAELDELFEEMVELPTRDLSLQVPLPRLLPPQLEALRAAIDDDDREALDAAMPAALAQLDGPLLRAGLARAVLAMRDGGRVAPKLAAVAVADLCVERSALVEAGLALALAVIVGAAPTPSGLVLVAR